MADEIQMPDATAVPDSPPAEVAPLAPVTARFDRADAWSFAVTALVAFSVYWFTLVPNVTLEDSGILSVGAMYAGVSSPPGYPVWTIYSWLFVKLLPFSNIAWRIAIGSAVASALACGSVALMVSFGGRMAFGGMTSFSQLKSCEQNLLRGVCGCVAGLVLGFSGPVWDYAVIVETQSLSFLLFVGGLSFLLRWFFEPGRRRFLYATFFLFGLLLTNSQELLVALPGLTAAVMLADEKLGRDLTFFALPLIVLGTIRNQSNAIWTVYLTNINWPMLGMFLAVLLAGIALAIKTRRVGNEWKAALLCGFCFLLGLAFYLYLPIASMTNPPVNWAYPRTVEGFLHALGRGQFERVHPTESLRAYINQIGLLALITGKKFGWLYPGFAAVPFGMIRWIQSTGRRWLLILLTTYACVGFGLLAQINPPADRQALEIIEVYFAPSFAILAVLFGLGLIIIGAKITKSNAEIST